MRVPARDQRQSHPPRKILVVLFLLKLPPAESNSDHLWRDRVRKSGKGRPPNKGARKTQRIQILKIFYESVRKC